MDYKPYESWDFCKSVECDALRLTEDNRKFVSCHKCYAYQMHQYLQDHGQILDQQHIARARQLEAESAAMLERVQRLESIAEAAQEVLQKEPTIICPRCDGSAGVERCVCEPWELLRQTVVEFKRVEGGK